VVAGSRNYVGAAALAAGGAYRAGAGLVTIATPESVYPIVAGRALEATHLPLPEASPGHVSASAAEVVREQAPQYEALVVGCGMGQSAETRAFLERLLLADPPLDVPLLLDADGLNNLAQIDRWHERLHCHAVLTPHPGEMARLTGLSAGDIQSKRWETAQGWARRWGQVVVLKGAFTVVASPSAGLAVSPFANPALASAGTGDVLAGAIGGLLAQRLTPFEAACCGVYLHAAAGERVRTQVGDSGLLAGELWPHIAHVAHDLRAGRA
jgi:NAD(P)H-hydrate epimerase